MSVEATSNLLNLQKIVENANVAIASVKVRDRAIPARTPVRS